MAASREDGLYAATIPTIGRAATFLVMVLGPLALTMALVVLPMSEHLTETRAQVVRLEAKIAELHAASATVAGANGLLAELAEQRGLAAAAESALDRFARLERRLEHRIAGAERASAALDKIGGLTARIEQQGALLDAARAALVTTSADPADLYAAIDRAGRMAPAVAEAERLATGLAVGLKEAHLVADRSLRSVRSLSRSQRLMSLEVDRVAAASKTLDGLVRLESRLNAPLMAVAASHDRLDELLRLKDQVLALTADLPAAFETLDMIVALQADYQRARGVFESMQSLMADLTLLEPSIGRAVALVEPMIDRTTIGSLASSELRLVLREMRARQSAEIAKLAPAAAEKVAGRSEAAPAK